MNLPDSVVGHLREVAEQPDFSGTRYELCEKLGHGGMGVVYSALDRDLQREVAIKVVATHAMTPRMKARLLEEAKVIAQLEHPGIVPVHDAGILPDDRAWYAMKLVRGRRLDEVARNARLPELLEIFLRICDAVAFAHDRGIVHRDLKPGNVMLGAFGEVLVMDWGIATRIGSREAVSTEPPSPSSSAGGTEGFMSPEQERGDAVDARSDVFALGALLRFLMAKEGARPLESIAARATAPDPAERYQSVLELAVDVRQFLQQSRVVAHRESPLELVGRWVSRYRVPIGVVVAYLTMRVALFLWLGR